MSHLYHHSEIYEWSLIYLFFYALCQCQAANSLSGSSQVLSKRVYIFFLTATGPETTKLSRLKSTGLLKYTVSSLCQNFKATQPMLLQPRSDSSITPHTCCWLRRTDRSGLEQKRKVSLTESSLQGQTGSRSMFFHWLMCDSAAASCSAQQLLIAKQSP